MKTKNKATDHNEKKEITPHISQDHDNKTTLLIRVEFMEIQQHIRDKNLLVIQYFWIVVSTLKQISLAFRPIIGTRT